MKKTLSERIVETNERIDDLNDRLESILVKQDNAMKDFRKEFGQLLIDYREQIIKLETLNKKEKEKRVRAIEKLK